MQLIINAVHNTDILIPDATYGPTKGHTADIISMADVMLEIKLVQTTAAVIAMTTNTGHGMFPNTPFNAFARDVVIPNSVSPMELPMMIIIRQQLMETKAIMKELSYHLIRYRKL